MLEGAAELLLFLVLTWWLYDVMVYTSYFTP
jgi:hypothetical protein